MRTEPIVWIVKEQVRRGTTGPEAMDYTPAMKWGELRFITQYDPPSHVTRGSSLMKSWWSEVQNFYTEFNPEIDFIIASGQPTAMMMVAYLVGRYHGNNTEFGRPIAAPRFLLWRREEGGYIPYDPLNIKE